MGAIARVLSAIIFLMVVMPLQASEAGRPRAQIALPVARQSVTTEAEGVGATASAALARALANAVQQVNGVAALQAADVQTQLGQLTALTARGDIANLRWNAETTGRTVTAAQGALKSYEVLSQQQTDKDTWRVRVRARVYRVDGDDAVREAMPRLAIIATFARDSDVGMPAIGDRQTVLRRFRARLQQTLLQTGAVRVLDRDNFSVSADELMLAGDSLRPDNLAKLGQRFAADYVVVVDAQRLRLADRGREMYGTWVPRMEAELQAEVRIIDVATQELVKSGEVQRFLTQPDMQAIAEQADINPRLYPDRYQEALLKALTVPVQQVILAQVAPDAAVPAPVAQPGSLRPADTVPARETPGSSEKPFSW